MASAKAMMPWQCRATVRSWLLYLLRRSVCQRRRVRVVPSQGRRPKHSAVLAQNASGAASDVYSQLRLPRSGARPLPCRRSAGSTRAVDEGWFAGTPMGLPAAQAPAASCGVVVTQLRLSRSGARPLPCRRSAGSATRAGLQAPQWGCLPQLPPRPAVWWSRSSGSRAAEPGRCRVGGRRLVRRRGLVCRHPNGAACPRSRRARRFGGHPAQTLAPRSPVVAVSRRVLPAQAPAQRGPAVVVSEVGWFDTGPSLSLSGARPVVTCRRSAGSSTRALSCRICRHPNGLACSSSRRVAASCGSVVTQLRLSLRRARPLPCRRSARSRLSEVTADVPACLPACLPACWPACPPIANKGVFGRHNSYYARETFQALGAFPGHRNCIRFQLLACVRTHGDAVQLYSYGCSSPLPHSNSGTKE